MIYRMLAAVLMVGVLALPETAVAHAGDHPLDFVTAAFHLVSQPDHLVLLLGAGLAVWRWKSIAAWLGFRVAEEKRSK